MALLDDSLVNRAAPPGSMRYFSLLYAPENRREQLLALYVIDAEMRESAQTVNHDVAHTRLRLGGDEEAGLSHSQRRYSTSHRGGTTCA